MRSFAITVMSIFVSCFPAQAQQGFPWNNFTSRSLKEIVEIDRKEINESDIETRAIVHADLLLSVVRVTYKGKKRPISTDKKDFLTKYWGPLFAKKSPEYMSLYENDFLFLEADTEYWLPVQKQVSEYFSHELKPDDQIDIYLVRAGGTCKKRQCDWAFLVEEFRKPKSEGVKN